MLASVDQMNYRKIIILPLSFFICHLIYIGCCKCPEVFERYYEVLSATVRPSGSGNAVVDNGQIITVDTLYLTYNFNNKCLAKKNLDLSFLVNSAYACSCRGCGEDGLKNKLSFLQVTSDIIYNGIAPDQSLNSFFKVKRNYSLYEDYSVDSLVKAVNNGYRHLDEVSFFTKVKPGNNAGHQLKLTMAFTNGIVVSVSTNPIRWQ